VLAIWIRQFEAVADPDKVVEEFNAGAPKDEDFFDSRIADYVVATRRNRKTNNDIAQRLRLAVMLLCLGVALHLVTLLVALGSAPKPGDTAAACAACPKS
jgi:hypothetical protein